MLEATGVNCTDTPAAAEFITFESVVFRADNKRLDMHFDVAESVEIAERFLQHRRAPVRAIRQLAGRFDLSEKAMTAFLRNLGFLSLPSQENQS